MERNCNKHGVTAFAFRKDGRWRCKKCASEAVTRRRIKNKIEAIEQAGGKCQLCGYDRCVAALHFHHLDPSTKKFGLGGKGQTLGREKRFAELAKCILLCANCHAETEFNDPR